MRIVVHGQQAFGKAVLEALLERGENVVGVFCAPDKEGRPEDPLKTFALEKGLTLHQPASWKTEEAAELMQSFDADVCIMAYVTLFVPQKVLDIPRLGTFQYHPSLLPLHRGPSSINWPIIMGATKTGLTIFWPDEGLDEGPVLLQKEVEIGPDDTLGSLYFNHLFPMGVAAMLESLDLVRDGKAPRIEQDHSKATYESWCRKADAEIDWAKPVDEVYNLIRGTNPQPGAWTTLNGQEVKIFDSAKIAGSDSLGGSFGEVVAVSDEGVAVAAAGGAILVKKVRPAGAGKIAAREFAAAEGVEVGSRFGS